MEITGPVDRKMTINALNSGAKVWLADMEDSSTPTWRNVIQGQLNLTDALERRIDFTSPEGKEYKLRAAEELPTIVVRPRGWHLPEKHMLIDGKPVAGGVVDFGLFFFHNARRLLAQGKARTSTCPRSRTTSRPGSGTTSSSWPRTCSASRRAPSAPPC
ncbi:malate synthase [Arthrobacter sp. Hiyo8]|nr:malate synthase [Arthrobacter sp. Hiyo8]